MEFTIEMMEKLREAYKADRIKYSMEIYARSNRTGRFFFIGWNIPSSEGVIRKYSGNLYLYTKDSSGEYRYNLSDEVCELLNIGNNN